MKRFLAVFSPVLLAAAPLLWSSCDGNCRTDCPATAVSVWASPGENLGIKSGTRTGPACYMGPGVDYCIPDAMNPCIGFQIVGYAAGSCDVSLVFNDGRPNMTIHTEFGPPTTQGCCQGNPVINGPSTIVIPPLGWDGGTDAVSSDASPSDSSSPDASAD